MKVTREVLEDFERKSKYIVSDSGSIYKLYKGQPKAHKDLIIQSPVIGVYESELKNIVYTYDGWFINSKDDYAFQFANVSIVYK